MTTYKPSVSFLDAASYLSNASNLSNLPNEMKLELYGLYKFLTVSPEPQTTRPSIFSFEGRAKWDAWKAVGSTWRNRCEAAEGRYMDIAKGLGWRHGASNHSAEPSRELTVEELLEQESDPEGSDVAHGAAMGIGVSTMSALPITENNGGGTIHDLAVAGDTDKLLAHFKATLAVDVNARDDYGFTALHLACDRGHTSVVTALLQNGADTSVKDSDGLTALDLAREANQEDIVTLLESYKH